MSLPCQSGELADSASSSGRWPAHPVHQLDRLLRRGALPRARAARTWARGARARASSRTRAGSAGRWTPGPPARRRTGWVPLRRRTQAERAELRVERQPQVPQLGPAPGTVLWHPRAQLQRRLVGLGVTCEPSSGSSAGSTRSISLRERPVLGLEQHDLLLDPERVVGRGALGRPPRPPGSVMRPAPPAARRALRRLHQAREEAPLLRALDQALRVPLHAEAKRGRAPRSPPPRRPATSRRRGAAAEPVDRLVVEGVDDHVSGPRARAPRARRGHSTACVTRSPAPPDGVSRSRPSPRGVLDQRAAIATLKSCAPAADRQNRQRCVRAPRAPARARSDRAPARSDPARRAEPPRSCAGAMSGPPERQHAVESLDQGLTASAGIGGITSGRPPAASMARR